jgi:integration host factor subunit beta
VAGTGAVRPVFRRQTRSAATLGEGWFHRELALTRPEPSGSQFRDLIARRTLTKAELIAELATAHPHLRDQDVETIVDTIFDGITSALARGDRAELRGFGSFSLRHRDPRMGRNPRNGEPVSVDAKSVPFFRAGKDLRLRVNAGRPCGPPVADRKRG